MAESESYAVTTRRLRKLFAILDDDENGTLDAEELKVILNEQSGHNFSDTQMGVLVQSVSSTGKYKKLKFDEFLELIAYTHKVKRIFSKFDTDDSGHIDHAELEEALSAVDEDDSGSIGYEEFFQLEFFLKRAETIFEAADDDGSGELSFSELKELLPVVDVEAKNDSEVRRMMKALDNDGSGKLSFEEFVNLLFCLMYDIEP